MNIPTTTTSGCSYTISSACSTGAHCIGVGMEQIQLGKQDVMFCGAGEADTIRDQSAKDGFLINTSPPPTNKEKERAKARKCVKPQCAKIVEKYLVVYNI